MLPGRYSYPQEYGTSYWVVDLAGRDRVLRDYSRCIGLEMLGIIRLEGVFLQVANRLICGLRFKNATGKSNVSRQVVEYLAERGFEDLYLVADWAIACGKPRLLSRRGT